MTETETETEIDLSKEAVFKAVIYTCEYVSVTIEPDDSALHLRFPIKILDDTFEACLSFYMHPDSWDAIAKRIRAQYEADEAEGYHPLSVLE